MRGLVTLATAFALPADFPQRDLIVLTAFAVVLATLVVQGLTLGPLVRLLELDGESGVAGELATGRAELAEAALAALEGQQAPPPTTGAIRSRRPGPPRHRAATPRPRGQARSRPRRAAPPARAA